MLEDIKYSLKRIRSSTIKFFEDLRRWFSYYKVVRRTYDFDWTSIYEVEKHQITQVRKAIAKYHSHLNYEYDLSRIDLALKMLNIILEEGSAKMVSGEGLIFKENNEVDIDCVWELPFYVNIRNAYRFVSIKRESFEDPSYQVLAKDTLRLQKAWELYHKIKMYYAKSWWD